MWHPDGSLGMRAVGSDRQAGPTLASLRRIGAMEPTPAERVALVTGSRTGIGRGIAEFLVAAGYRVVGCSRGDAAPLANGGDRYEHHRVDVGDEVQVRRLIGEIRSRHGRLDVVVNNAAVNAAALTLATSGASAAEVLRTNVLGTFLVSRESAMLMMPRRSGRIVNLGSIAVPLGMEGTAIYSASKAAVIQFTRVLAAELAPVGITCNAIAPSVVETSMAGALGEAALGRSVERLTIKRKAVMADVTNALDFFLRPESAYVTGQVLYLGLAAS